MKKFVLCWLMCGFAWTSQAQQPVPSPGASPAPIPTLPPGPLIKGVPDRMSWLVTTTSKPAANLAGSPAASPAGAAPSAKPGNASGGQKIAPVVHTWTTTDNGKEEIWSNGKTMITTNAAWKVPIFSAGSPEEYPRPNWISRKNIKEIKKEGDKEYWIFRDHIFPGGETITKDMVLPGEDLESLKVDATAVIDAQTRLPVGVQVGSMITTFKFEAMPDAATLNLPAELTAMIVQRQERIEASTRHAVRP